MTRDSEFYSGKTQRAWRSAGEKLCAHPSFSKDGNGWGPDEVDYYCTTCGEIKVGRNGKVPLPRGH